MADNRGARSWHCISGRAGTAPSRWFVNGVGSITYWRMVCFTDQSGRRQSFAQARFPRHEFVDPALHLRWPIAGSTGNTLAVTAAINSYT